MEDLEDERVNMVRATFSDTTDDEEEGNDGVENLGAINDGEEEEEQGESRGERQQQHGQQQQQHEQQQQQVDERQRRYWCDVNAANILPDGSRRGESIALQ